MLNLLAEGEEVHLVPIKRTLQCCHLKKEEESQGFLGGERKFKKDYLHYIIIILLLTNIQKINDLSDKEKCC